MKIDGVLKQEVNISVTEYDISKFLMYEPEISIEKMIRSLQYNYAKRCTKKSSSYIKNGMWMWDEETHTSHSFTIDHTLRKATETEVMIYNSFDQLVAAFVEEKISN